MILEKTAEAEMQRRFFDFAKRLCYILLSVDRKEVSSLEVIIASEFSRFVADNTIISQKEFMELMGVSEEIVRVVESIDRQQFLLRHVDEALDNPQHIGLGQTMSAKWMVMWQAALTDIQPGDRVLEIGGGCGYLATILSKLGAEVHAVEYHKELAWLARRTVPCDVTIWHGNGFLGVEDRAPFNKVVVSCAAPNRSVFERVLTQLVPSGKVISPLTLPAYNCEVMTVTRFSQAERKIDYFDLPLAFVPALDYDSQMRPVLV